MSSSLKRLNTSLFWSLTAHAALLWAIGASMLDTPSSPTPTLNVDLRHITPQTSIAPNPPNTSVAKSVIADKVPFYPPQKKTPSVKNATTQTPVTPIVEVSESTVISEALVNNSSVENNTPTNTVAAPATTNTPNSEIEKPIFDAAFLKNPQPSYPVFAKKRQQQGTVMLKVKVSTEGKAELVELAQSSGFPLLDDAAQQTVAKWQFVPARHGDLAVIASVIVPIRFALR